MKDNIFIGRTKYEHGEKPKIGILLTNLGTPDAPEKGALRRYLKEFLSDNRVIELPRWKWWPILNLIVLNTRPKKVAHAYQSIWTEQGSPLLVITNSQAEGLRKELEAHSVVISVGMRYGNPSIAKALQELREQGAQKILVLPMYGQYASATTGSTFDAVVDELKKWRWVPELRTIMQFHDHPGYIQVVADNISKHWQKNGQPEKLIMSFHGIPKRYFQGGDPYFCHCQKTGRLIAERLGLKQEQYLVTFQSLFGKEEWIKPYTDKTLEHLAKTGVKSIDVVCPGFLADCLETIEEIDVENRENFLEAGGEKYSYIPAVNDNPAFIKVLADIVRNHIWQEAGEVSLAAYQKFSSRA